MSKIHLLSATPPDDVHGRLELHYLQHSATQDRFQVHQPVDDPETADLIIFAERENAAGPHLENVRQHPLVHRFRERCFVFNPRYKGLPFLPGVYASISREYHHPSRTRSGHYPEVHVNEPFTFEPPADDLPYLYSFVGVCGTAPVRCRLAALDHDRGLFLDTSDENINLRKVEAAGADEERYMKRYAKLTKESKFVLCPRGMGPSTLRLFESMRMGRAPVIVSDAWVPPEGPSWKAFSLRVAESEVERLPALLAENEHRAVAMGHRARQVWEDWFAPASSFHRIVEWCLDIQAARPLPESLMHYAAYRHQLAPSYLLRRARRSRAASKLRSFLS